MYTTQFLEHLRSKMARAECLYCDKTFRDYKTLREHMRKKLHKKLNPSNTGDYTEVTDCIIFDNSLICSIYDVVLFFVE